MEYRIFWYCNIGANIEYAISMQSLFMEQLWMYASYYSQYFLYTHILILLSTPTVAWFRSSLRQYGLRCAPWCAVPASALHSTYIFVDMVFVLRILHVVLNIFIIIHGHTEEVWELCWLGYKLFSWHGMPRGEL